MKFSITQGITILAAGFVFLAFVLVDKQAKVSPVPDVLPHVEVQEPEDDVAINALEWVEYRNEELGFRIQHPSTWFVEEQGRELALFPDAENRKTLHGTLADLRISMLASPSAGEALENERQSSSWEDPITGESNCGPADSSFVGIHDALTMICYEQVDGNQVHIFSLDARGGALEMRYQEFRIDQVERIAIYERILSTFEFIEPAAEVDTLEFIEPMAEVDTSDWVEYRNDGFGVRFENPGSWELTRDFEPAPDCTNCSIHLGLNATDGTYFSFGTGGRGLHCSVGRRIDYAIDIDENGKLGLGDIENEVSLDEFNIDCLTDVSDKTIIITNGEHNGKNWSFWAIVDQSQVEQTATLMERFFSTFELID